MCSPKKMCRKRGRPVKLNHGLIDSKLKKYNNQLVENGSFVSKHSSVWKTVADEIGQNQTPASLYAYACGLRKDLQSEIFPDFIPQKKKDLSINDLNQSNASSSYDSFIETEVELHFSKNQIQEILETRVYNRNESKRPRTAKTRTYHVFTPDKWQKLIIEKLEEKKINHGYQFKNHKIYNLHDNAEFSGKCKCGGTIRGNFTSLTKEINRVICYTTDGDGTCGKRYLKGEERRLVGKDLYENGKSAMVFCTTVAGEKMSDDEDPEPATLYEPRTYRQAKMEYGKSQHKHTDPVTALDILMGGVLQTSIHNLGHRPFFAHYWANSQTNVLDTYLKRNKGGCIYIDASGSYVHKIKRPDGSLSSHIFLYIMVINTGEKVEFSQFPVSQMLAERQTALSIYYWLAEHTRLSYDFKFGPNEAVCDSSRALLLAILWNYTEFKTLEDYSNRCFNGPMPNFYLRIDVAHFMKIYANFLKSEHKSVKTFFLGALGKLVVSRNFSEAKKILKLILIVCRSEHQGKNESGNMSICSLAKENLKKLLVRHENIYKTGNDEVDIVLEKVNDSDGSPTHKKGVTEIEDVLDESNETSNETQEQSSCFQWAKTIDDHVRAKLIKQKEKGKGEDANAHFNIKLAEKLIHDCKTIPLWSCVVRDEFGFGRVPASSAPVESEFDQIRNHVFKGKSLLRSDVFVTKHLEYIRNYNLIVSARNKVKEKEAEKEAEKEVEKEAEKEKETQKEQTALAEKEKEVKKREDLTNLIELDDSIPSEVVQQEPKIQNQCELCAENPKTGAHKCIVCKKVVHLLPYCSVEVEGTEEGYGQERLCLDCDKIKKTKTTRDNYNKLEDWKLQASEPDTNPKRRARYIHSEFNEEELNVHGTLNKIPLLLNGTKLHLKPVKLDSKLYTVTNTCAFDAIFQSILLAEIDGPFLEEIPIEENMLFLSAIQEVKMSSTEKKPPKISNVTYGNRTKILIKSKYSTIKALQLNNEEVICTSNTGDLAAELLANLACIQQVGYCKRKACGFVLEEEKIHVGIVFQSLLAGDFSRQIIDSMEKWVRPEECPDCGDKLVIKTEVPGNFIFVNLISDSGTREIRLKDIPQKLTLPNSISEDEFTLFAVIDYKIPRSVRAISDSTVGHYIAHGRRPNNTWILMDDMQTRVKKTTAEETIVPVYLFYRSITQTD